MIIINTVSQWRTIRAAATGYNAATGHNAATGDTAVTGIGFVPTMGALHEGHLSLVRRCRAENALTVVSIFLNPTQFNNPSDLSGYPVSFAGDCALLEREGVSYLFAPDYREMYPDEYRYRLSENTLSAELCGASRPGHFEGVLTVVMKLFNIIRPQRAYFGEKDYQQYQLIRGMAEAFFMDTEVIPCPLVREESGLALSSRNRRLSPAGLLQAPTFYRSLSSGESLPAIRAQLEGAGFRVDYLEEREGRLFGAVFLEEVRLIDNVQR